MQLQHARRVLLRENRAGLRRRWLALPVALGFAAPFLAAYLVFQVWPIVSGFQISFYDVSLLGGDWQWVGATNYIEALTSPDFWSSIWHSSYYTILSTPPHVVLALGLALLARRTQRGGAILRVAIFMPFLLPVTVMAVMWDWIYQPQFGLLNGALQSLRLPAAAWLANPSTAMPAVAAASVWWTLGFNFVLYLAGLQAIPKEVEEASEIDGAGAWARLWYITLPLVKRTTVIVVVLQVLASLKVFGQIYAMTNGGPSFATRPLLQLVYDEGFTSFHLGYAAAISYLYFLILLAVSIVQFRIFRQGGET
ncbi:MAG: sugar ABC transporter permease [Candidatus Dormibacteraeota bacterium]|nr:sugar ABC transporter permease [Candidatus Dormibacteraeota bacterium]